MKHTKTNGMKKRWISAMLTAALFVALFAGSAENIAAAAKAPSFLSKKFVVFEGREEKDDIITVDMAYLGIKNRSVNAEEIDDVKNSNEDVCACGSLFYLLETTDDGLYCVAYKAGTNKVTYKLKQGGKTYTLKTTVKVKKASKKNLPFSYVKVDGENFYKKGSYNSCELVTDDHTAKIEYKLNKGWKLKSMYTHTHYEELEKDKDAEEEGSTDIIDVGKKTSDKKIKNGQKVKLRTNLRHWNTEVFIDVVNKSGEVCHYVIYFSKDD